MPNSTPGKSRAIVHNQMKSYLCRMLALAEEHTLDRPITARCRDRARTSIVTIGPRGAQVEPDSELSGHFFSPLESAVWVALKDSPLLGKQIAAALGRKYDPELKYLLSNLEERGVITRVAGRGYFRSNSPELTSKE